MEHVWPWNVARGGGQMHFSAVACCWRVVGFGSGVRTEYIPAHPYGVYILSFPY